jgi:6-phosphofructokinase 1
MEYTRDLGYGAAKFLVEGGNGATITLQHGRLVPVPFARMFDETSGLMRLRYVDIQSDRYKIARTYMIRLKREDFDDKAELAKIAAAAGLTIEDFREQFGHVVHAGAGATLAPPAIRMRS